MIKQVMQTKLRKLIINKCLLPLLIFMAFGLFFMMSYWIQNSTVMNAFKYSMNLLLFHNLFLILSIVIFYFYFIFLANINAIAQREEKKNRKILFYLSIIIKNFKNKDLCNVIFLVLLINTGYEVIFNINFSITDIKINDLNSLDVLLIINFALFLISLIGFIGFITAYGVFTTRWKKYSVLFFNHESIIVHYAITSSWVEVIDDLRIENSKLVTKSICEDTLAILILIASLHISKRLEDISEQEKSLMLYIKEQNYVSNPFFL